MAQLSNVTPYEGFGANAGTALRAEELPNCDVWGLRWPERETDVSILRHYGIVFSYDVAWRRHEPAAALQLFNPLWVLVFFTRS